MSLEQAKYPIDFTWRELFILDDILHYAVEENGYDVTPELMSLLKRVCDVFDKVCFGEQESND